MPTPTGLSLLTFNIGNPSAARARRQLDWLATRPEQVLVLTETKDSEGCRMLAEAFTAAGFDVVFPRPTDGDYGTMIVSRVRLRPDDDFRHRLSYLPARTVAALLPTDGGPVRLLGMYVPSRDASPEKTERKRTWLAGCHAALADAEPLPTVLLGDLNILEPDHQPRYPFFAPFEYDFYRALTTDHGLVDTFRHLHPTDREYSWVGRTGDGYRYDHAFCSTSLQAVITSCSYDHQPRADRLSDHSALTLDLGLHVDTTLATSDPRTVTEPATLF